MRTTGRGLTHLSAYAKMSLFARIFQYFLMQGTFVIPFCLWRRLSLLFYKTFAMIVLKLPWIGEVLSKFKNQINKAIASYFYAVKPRMVYSTRVMLPSAKKDSFPTTQKSCVVYEFSCRCEARCVGRTKQRLADKIKQHVPTSIRKESNTVREQPPCLCENNNSKINCESAIVQHLLTNPEYAKTYIDDNFRIIGQARSSFL